MQNYNKKPV